MAAQRHSTWRTDMLGSILTEENMATFLIGNISPCIRPNRGRSCGAGKRLSHSTHGGDGINWDGLEYFNTASNKGSVFLFKPSAKAADGDSKVIKLKGLDRGTSYALTFQDRTTLNCVLTGAQSMDRGVTVTGMAGDRASEIIWIESMQAARSANRYDFPASEAQHPMRRIDHPDALLQDQPQRNQLTKVTRRIVMTDLNRNSYRAIRSSIRRWLKWSF